MMGKPEGPMGHGMMMQHDPEMMKWMMIWEKLDEKTKKTLMLRMLDGKIMMKEGMIKHFQYKIETMKLLKAALEKM